MELQTLTGTVKFFLEGKGYGFIKEDNSDKEYFFHASDSAQKKFEKEEKVSFQLFEGRRGMKAIRVKRLNK